MDWAEKITEQWADELDAMTLDSVTRSLRKAKADGMREAADMVAARRGTVTIDVCHALRHRANQIEKGNE